MSTESEFELEKKLINQLKVSSEVSNLLNRLKGSLEEYIIKVEKYPIEKQKILDKQKRLDEEKNEYTATANNIEAYIQSFTNRDEVIRKHKERNTHEELININTQKLGCYKGDIDKYKKELDEVQNKINKMIQEQKE